MRKILMGLGGLTLGLIIIVVIGFFLFNPTGKRLDRESKEYVDQVVPMIAASWDSDLLFKEASPELIKAAPPEKIRPLFQALAQKLGPLKEYKGSKGQANIFVSSKNGKVVTGTYVAEADFQKAPAKISVKTIQHDGRWQLLMIYVNSDALLPQPS